MFLITWTIKETITNPYWNGFNDGIEPERIEVHSQKYAIVDCVEHMATYKDYKDVEFFEINRQIFPKFSTIVKAEF